MDSNNGCPSGYRSHKILSQPLSAAVFSLMLVGGGANAADPLPPPDGFPGGGTPPGGDTSTSSTKPSGAYTLNGETSATNNTAYNADSSDQSAIYVTNGGTLSLLNPTIVSTSAASSVDDASKYGIDAGILVEANSHVGILDGSITTSSSGANGLFATGSKANISMSNGTITTTGASAHGVDVTYGGTINLSNVTIKTIASNSSGIATDFGGGTVNFTGGTVDVSGFHSAGIYSTGNILGTDAVVTATDDNGAVIDADGVINLTNVTLTGSTNGLMVWNTIPSASTATAIFRGGSVTAQDGDAVYVKGTSAHIYALGGAKLNASSGNLVNAASGSTVDFAAVAETLEGKLTADDSSNLAVELSSSSLNGSLNNLSLTLDNSSTITLTADSTVNVLLDAAGLSGNSVTNITGNGYNLYYDAGLAANAYLHSKTYTLVGGGSLIALNPVSEDKDNCPLPASRPVKKVINRPVQQRRR